MKQALKYLILTGLFLLLYCIQSAFAQKLTVWGVSPDILPYAVAAVAVFCGQTAGAWLGAFAGFLTDMSSPVGLGLAMPVWFLVGAFGGKWTKRYLRRGFSGVFLFGLAASVAERFGMALFGFGSGVPLPLLLLRALKTVLYSALLSPVAYLLFRAVEHFLPAPYSFADHPGAVVIRGFPFEGFSECASENNPENTSGGKP